MSAIVQSSSTSESGSKSSPTDTNGNDKATEHKQVSFRFDLVSKTDRFVVTTRPHNNRNTWKFVVWPCIL